MKEINSISIKSDRKLATLWGITLMIVFPLLITLGLLMRISQGEMAKVPIGRFYSYMTLHGLGMVGVLFSAAFSGLWYFTSTRFVKLNVKLGYFVYVTIILGVLGLAYAALVGKFGAGWYVLYPLPFVGGYWTEWSTTLTTVSLLVLGVAWLIGMLHMLYATAKEYGGFTNTLGWQYLTKKEVKKDLPPFIMIVSISLIPGILAVFAGAVMLIMFLMQISEPSLSFDPLLLKNLVMYFGHAIANITMYCAVGWVYLLLPEFTGRKIKTDKVLVLSWNATLIFITFAFFHHMYMDFGQPLSLQIFGQIISYSSAVPATAITMFTVISSVYRAKIKWTIIPLLFLIGMAGWAAGGFAAVIDSTIAMNKVLHNTLWVPAHFHTYMLMGVVLFIIAYLFYLFSSDTDKKGGPLAKFGFGTFAVGAIGFLTMFYMGGANSIPRRYNDYSGTSMNNVHEMGAMFAKNAVYFIYIVLIGLLIIYIALFIKLAKRSSENASAETGNI